MPQIHLSFVYPRNSRFQCTRCTLCCGNTETRTRHILMLKSEVHEIAERAPDPVETFAFRIEGHAPYAYEMQKRDNGKCLFLRENVCTIYESRPLICRFYPFELKPSRSGTHVIRSTDECPGIGKGKPRGKRFFDDLYRMALEKLGQDTKER